MDLIALVAAAVNGTVAELTFDEKRMAGAISSSMMATDLADYLVKKGSTFRQAHEAVGSLIRESEKRACDLGALELESFTSAHSLFDADVYDWLAPARSVFARNLSGGTGPH